MEDLKLLLPEEDDSSRKHADLFGCSEIRVFDYPMKTVRRVFLVFWMFWGHGRLGRALRCSLLPVYWQTSVVNKADDTQKEKLGRPTPSHHHICFRHASNFAGFVFKSKNKNKKTSSSLFYVTAGKLLKSSEQSFQFCWLLKRLSSRLPA